MEKDEYTLKLERELFILQNECERLKKENENLQKTIDEFEEEKQIKIYENDGWLDEDN